MGWWVMGENGEGIYYTNKSVISLLYQETFWTKLGLDWLSNYPQMTIIPLPRPTMPTPPLSGDPHPEGSMASLQMVLSPSPRLSPRRDPHSDGGMAGL